MRSDQHCNNELRPVKMTLGYLDHPAGSVLIEAGKRTTDKNGKPTNPRRCVS